MIILQQIFIPVREEMELLNDSYKTILQNNDPLLKTILSEITLCEGKKLRSAMVFLSAGATGKINTLTQTSAFGLELLHYSSLIHDDVLDNGQIRHNRSTINVTWNNKTAILIGDYLLSECMNFIVRANHPELLLKLSDIAKTMVCGELLQLAKENSSSFSEKEYMKIIRYKTATLISACFEMGVTSCISDAKIINQWKIFGEELGIIFQLKDDLLDYQTSDSSSKDAYKDIREHKITLPFIIALQQTSDREKTQLLDFYMKHRGTTEEVQTIIDIVRERGGIDYVEALIDTGAKKCMNFVRQQRDSDYRQSLLLLVEFIRDRKF